MIYVILYILDLIALIFVFYPAKIISSLQSDTLDNSLYKNKVQSDTAVLLLHGIGKDESFVMPVRYYLLNCRVYSCDLGGKTLSIEEQAEIAYNYIKSINYKRLVVIGHSMGGLVGGVLCQMCKVDLLITICTPWRGVPVLDYFGFLPRFDYTSFKQMKPDSCFLTTWRNLLHWQPAITVGSNYDLKVPDNYSHLNNSLQITRTLGHNSILLDAGMWALLSVFI